MIVAAKTTRHMRAFLPFYREQPSAPKAPHVARSIDPPKRLAQVVWPFDLATPSQSPTPRRAALRTVFEGRQGRTRQSRRPYSAASRKLERIPTRGASVAMPGPSQQPQANNGTSRLRPDNRTGRIPERSDTSGLSRAEQLALSYNRAFAPAQAAQEKAAQADTAAKRKARAEAVKQIAAANPAKS